MRTPERSRRSLSQGGGEDTPRPSGSFSRDSPAPTQAPEGGLTTPQNAVEHGHASKRLGFLGEKLLSSNSGPSPSSSRGTTHQILPSRSHSRADSANLLTRDPAPSPAPSASSASVLHGKSHQSPSKLVSREMHRLGNLAHLPTLNSSVSATSSVTLVTSSIAALGGSASSDNPWVTVHMHLLGLFNGEPLQAPIEDLNSLVRRHIQTVVSAAPAKAMSTLENDATELITNGMVTLLGKLDTADDDAIAERVALVWSDFWDNILPYVEGVLLPLQTDPLLASLYRPPKTQRPPSPVGQKSGASASHKVERIDVRTIALKSFRNNILGPLDKVLVSQVSALKERFPNQPFAPPRFQQMVLLCLMMKGDQEAVMHGDREPSSGEVVTKQLFTALRTAPHKVPMPSFLSAGLPRDRRGRIARKQETMRGYKERAPDWGPAAMTREREREFLEALRSPGPADSQSARQSKGWGLGLGEERKAPEEEEDENLDWDQAQAVVERMVGLKPPETPNAADTSGSGRRRPS